MKSIWKRYMAWLLLLVTVFSCVSGVIPITHSQENVTADTEPDTSAMEFDSTSIVESAEVSISGNSSDGGWNVKYTAL